MRKFAILMTLVAGTVSAQSDLSQTLLACKAEQDSLQRLVCYDKAVAELATGASEVKETMTTKAAPEVEKTVSSTASTSTSVSAAPEAGSVRMDKAVAEDIFGRESTYKRDEIDQVKFVIKSASQSLRKKWRFTFENGQQWEQKDTDRFAKFEAGDEVIIKRGVMDAFYLKKLDANRTIRVKRVK